MKPTGACVILTKEDKILGVTRKYNHSDWGLPGGKLDPGETALEAIIRESKEETGLDITCCHEKISREKIISSKRFTHLSSFQRRLKIIKV